MALGLADGVLARSRNVEQRVQARRIRYQVLARAGKLDAEMTALEKRGATAERAFVALEVQGDYAAAERLYRQLTEREPDAGAYHAGLAQAQRAREIAEQERLYAEVLKEDPADRSAFEKYLPAAVAIGHLDEVKRRLEALLGRQEDPAALIEVARLCLASGLAVQGVDLLERAYRSEKEPARRQQILFALGDVYTRGQQVDRARRVFSDLAATAADADLRAQATARLVALVTL